jgi:hypothetical protein
MMEHRRNERRCARVIYILKNIRRGQAVANGFLRARALGADFDAQTTHAQTAHAQTGHLRSCLMIFSIPSLVMHVCSQGGSGVPCLCQIDCGDGVEACFDEHKLTHKSRHQLREIAVAAKISIAECTLVPLGCQHRSK